MQRETQKVIEAQVFGDYHIQRKLPFRIVQAPFRKFSKYERDGHWNEKERLKYTVFLSFFRKILEDQDLKKNARVYEMMSDMIITRNPSQCRSHHQKMEKHRKNITDIISSVAEKYQPSVYAEIQEKYTGLIKTLLENSDKYIRIPTNSDNQRPKVQKVMTLFQSGPKPENILEPISIHRSEEIEKPKRDNPQQQEYHQQGDQLKENQLKPIFELKNLVKKEEFIKGQAYQQCNVDKEKQNALKKTQDQYEEEESPQKQDSGSFQKYLLKAEAQQQRIIVNNITKVQIEPSFDRLMGQIDGPRSIIQGSSHPDTFSGLKINQQSREFLEQQLNNWLQQKQGCSTTANQLLMQWNACKEYLRICEQNIKYFSNALSIQERRQN